MQQSRRRSLALISIAITIGVAGCATFDGSENEPANSSPDVDLTVTISGPDGEESFFTGNDLASIGAVQDLEQQSGYGLPLELTDSGTDQATAAFNTVGAADDPDAASITHTIRGDVETEQTFGIAPSLANAIETGEWDGQFRLQFDDRDAAKTVKEALRYGD